MKTDSPYFFILYEGITDKIFLQKLFETKKINFSKSYIPLKGLDYSFTKLVTCRIIEAYAEKKIKIGQRPLHVIILYDRDGLIETNPNKIKAEIFNSEVSKSGVPIDSWMETVATKDLEGWFFYDINGLFDYLKVPVAKRTPGKYNSPEKLGCKDLQCLFHKNKRYYAKGEKAKNVIDCLDMSRISQECQELKNVLKYIERKI